MEQARILSLIPYTTGHVYTRMVHKALKVIAKLKDYQFELKVFEALLDQRFWCRGKRAKWYTRRAIILGHLVTKEKDPLKKRNLQLRILEGIKVALLDDDTGIGMSSAGVPNADTNRSCSLSPKPRQEAARPREKT